MENTVVWADIPVTDLDRAMKFYSAVLQQEFQKPEGMDGVAIIAPPPDFDPSQMQGTPPVSIDLAVVAANKPSADGCTIYLNSHGEPEAMLERAAAAGGKILQPVADMGEMVGFIGFFQDTEGNRIGVHNWPQR
jgi:predicted enzyme related to lactoylglutathione lyase